MVPPLSFDKESSQRKPRKIPFFFIGHIPNKHGFHFENLDHLENQIAAALRFSQ